METTIKTIVREVTPKLAEELLSRNGINRKLDDHTVDFYCEQMKSGNWMLTGEAIKIDKTGRLIDGQHRLKAVIKYGKGVEFLIIYGIDYNTFSVLDSGKNRTAADVFYIENIPNSTNKAAIIRNYLLRKNTKFYATVSKSGGGLGKRNITPSNKTILDKYNDNPKLWDELTMLFQKCNRHLRLLPASIPGGMAAYLILELNYDKSIVFNFFEELYGYKEDKYEITKKMRDTLLRDKISYRKIPGITKYVYLTKTWNSYIKGGNLKVLQFNIETDKIPELS